MIASVELAAPELRSGMFFLVCVLNAARTNLEDHTEAFSQVNADELRRNFYDIVTGTTEDTAPVATATGPATAEEGRSGVHGRDPNSALGRFTVDFTAEARAGRIDPIFERDPEIRQMVDILARRRKNNPIVVGEAGTGKTALVEGLALRIIAGDVPDFIANADLLALDMGSAAGGRGG